MLKATVAALTGALILGAAVPALAKDKTIAVSWKTFQEERWKTDEAAIKAVVTAAGNKYVSTDAQNSAEKQAKDIEGLITQKVDLLIIVAYDSDAILPSIKAAKDAGIKTMAYDVQFEDPSALYLTFDNIGVGRLMAKEVQKVKPTGNYAFIKGDKGDPNATFLFKGIMEVLGDAIKAGKIKNSCETFTDGWKPDNAQKNMEQCLTSTNNKVDAVVSWITDVMLSFPVVIFALAAIPIVNTMVTGSVQLSPSVGVRIATLVGVLVTFGWMSTARLVRGQVLSLREREFVEAARALGASRIRLVIRHILPNAMGPVIVAGTIDVAAAIIAESTLSFLGLGFPPDVPTWGRVLFDAKDYLDIAPHWALFPGAAIFLTVLSINFIGDGLRDALDPRRVL